MYPTGTLSVKKILIFPCFFSWLCHVRIRRDFAKRRSWVIRQLWQAGLSLNAPVAVLVWQSWPADKPEMQRCAQEGGKDLFITELRGPLNITLARFWAINLSLIYRRYLAGFRRPTQKLWDWMSVKICLPAAKKYRKVYSGLITSRRRRIKQKAKDKTVLPKY